MRAILFTDVCGSVAQTHQLGDDGHMQLLREHNEIVRSELIAHDGREVKHTGDGIMASFTSIVAAVDFAVAVQRRIQPQRERHEPFQLSIGISAGEPVTDDNDDLFGAAGATRRSALRGRRAGRHRRFGRRPRALHRQIIPLRRPRPPRPQGPARANATYAVPWHE